MTQGCDVLHLFAYMAGCIPLTVPAAFNLSKSVVFMLSIDTSRFKESDDINIDDLDTVNPDDPVLYKFVFFVSYFQRYYHMSMYWN